MKVVILAAGQGSRLRDLGLPKPLVPVAGRPLIAHVINAALIAGAREFIVITGYQAEPIEAFLGGLAAQRGLRLRCVRNPDWSLPNGLSLVAAEPLLSAPFLLLMADHLFEPGIVSGLLATPLGGFALRLAIDRRLDHPLVDLADVTRVLTSDDGRILRIGKGLAEFNAFDTGIFLASPALIQAVRDDVAAGGKGSLSEGVLRLAARGLATTFDMGARFWIDVDDANARARAEQAVAQRTQIRTPAHSDTSEGT